MSCIIKKDLAAGRKHVPNMAKESKLSNCTRRCKSPMYNQMGMSLCAGLKACARETAFTQGILVHMQIIEKGFDSMLYVCNALIDMYAKCGNLQEARKVFDKQVERDTVTWNAMIVGYALNMQAREAFKLFMHMQHAGKADTVTIVSILKACSSIAALSEGNLIFLHIIENGVELEEFVGSILIDLYAKCGCLDDACSVFDKLSKQDVVTWGTIIAAYAQQKDGISAFEIFGQMQLENINLSVVVFSSILKVCGSIQALDQGRLVHNQISRSGLQSDVVIGSTLVDMYVKCGSTTEARKAFDELQIRDVVTWGTMISGYVAHGHLLSALELLETMQLYGLMANRVILECLLRACGTIEYIEHGRLIYCQIITLGLELDRLICNTLADMYAKVGALDEAHKVFHELPCQDVQSWDALISRYVQHGHGVSALKLFDEMQEFGILPSKSTVLHILKLVEGQGDTWIKAC